MSALMSFYCEIRRRYYAEDEPRRCAMMACKDEAERRRAIAMPEAMPRDYDSAVVTMKKCHVDERRCYAVSEMLAR